MGERSTDKVRREDKDAINDGAEPESVLLMAYGGPASLDDVEPYLLDIRDGRETPPELVEIVRARYEAIGGRSPLREITEAQAHALHAELTKRGHPIPVYVGMRHWTPRITDTVAVMAEDGIKNAAAVIMAPHLCLWSHQRYRAAVTNALAAADAAIRFRFVRSWASQPGLRDAQLQSLAEALSRLPGGVTSPHLKVVFSAHSLPEDQMPAGETYMSELHDNARWLAEQVSVTDWTMSFQSAGARSTAWLGPHLEEELEGFSQAGCKALLVMPIGFVCDHVEILYDLDIELREQARTLGMSLIRAESMNCHPSFIAALADTVLYSES